MDKRLPLMILLTGVNNLVEALRKSGPYEFRIEQLEKCEGDNGTFKVFADTKIHYIGNGVYVYNGNITLGVPMDENMKIYSELQKWGNGGWRPKYMHYTFKNCEELWSMSKKDHIRALKAANSTVESCPVPAGRYEIKDLRMDFNLEKVFPVMEYGRYRGMYHIYYNKEFVGCTQWIVVVYPKTVKDVV